MHEKLAKAQKPEPKFAIVYADAQADDDEEDEDEIDWDDVEEFMDD